MPKQTELPGTERSSIPAIEIAAEEYVKARDKRMKLTEQEVAAKTKLTEAMQAHEDQLDENPDGDKVYRYDDECVVLQAGKVNVKVKRVHDETEDDDD